MTSFKVVVSAVAWQDDVSVTVLIYVQKKIRFRNYELWPHTFISRSGLFPFTSVSTV